MRNQKIDVVVAEVRQLTSKIKEYVLCAKDLEKLPDFEPGSHIEVHTTSEESGPIIRHYSLVGRVDAHGSSPDGYRIAVQKEDRKRGSAHIHDTFSVGTQLQVSWPKNNFPLDRREKHTLLLAGGIGITPIYAMLRSVVRRGKSFELVYAGRTPDAMAYLAEVQQLGGPNVRIHLSGEDGQNPLDIEALLFAQPEGTNVYVCGPKPMVDATFAAAAVQGWERGRVRSELFGSGPTGDDRAFDVELIRTGRIVHVGRDTTILDAMEREGISTFSDCRRGECGVCPLKILDVDGEILHRDRYLDEAQRASGQTLCICVSRISGARLILDA